MIILIMLVRKLRPLTLILQREPFLENPALIIVLTVFSGQSLTLQNALKS